MRHFKFPFQEPEFTCREASLQLTGRLELEVLQRTTAVGKTVFESNSEFQTNPFGFVSLDGLIIVQNHLKEV